MILETKRPIDANTKDFFLEMESDNFPQDSEKWSILVDADRQQVSLHKPHGGSWVEIPKKEFDAIVHWYTKPQRKSS
jgi:hypothetical protein